MGSVGSGGHNYLRFEKLPLEKGNKLHKYRVYNHTLYEEIGIIHWRGGWRKYVFTAKNHYADSIVEINGKKYIRVEDLIDIDMSVGCQERVEDLIDIDMSVGCQEKINEFIKKLMEEWKKSKTEGTHKK